MSENDKKGNRSEVQSDHDFCSGRISEQVRLISFAVLALVWLFIAGGTDKPTLPTGPDTTLLLATGAIAILAMVADYVQYLFGYLYSNAMLQQMDSKKIEYMPYNYNSCKYQVRKMCFVAKQVLCVSSLVLLFCTVLKSYGVGV